ncbi:MAG: peptidoglycan DD-metalloendopeptidase family protein, partial [Clostridia bacterium]|nr:peptidoglycan DD-metalloendopeptidase family protein [Clostridia bacterium]
KKKEESKAYSELKSINKTLNSTSKELRNTESNLYTAEEELAYLKKELEEHGTQLDYDTQVLEERLVSMYEQGDVHFLEVLLDSTSITDFLTRWDLMSRITESNIELIKTTKENISIVDGKKQQTLKKQQILAALKEDQNDKKRKLAIASSRQEGLYKTIKSDKVQAEKAVKDLEQQSLNIAAEIRRQTGDTSYLGSGKLAWPTPGFKRITSEFGWRIHPITKKRSMHTGTDIAANYGTNIVAAESGTVMEVAWRGGYGRIVMVDHGGGIVTLYAHTSKSLVKPGQVVKKGQAIAKIGTTGWSTGPHLHFEVRENGNPVNPMTYLK